MPADDRPKLDRKEHPYVFSPSQISTGALCLRKWAFEKIDQMPNVGSASTDLGTEVHNHLDAYLAQAVPINTKIRSGKIAMEGIKHLPLPKTPGMVVEGWFVRKRGQATYWGKKDVRLRRAGQRPKVFDHKTTKSLTWVKSEEDLRSDFQGGMYGWDEMEDTGSPDAELQWTYMTTEGKPKAFPVVVIIDRDEAEEVMERVDKVASQLITLHKELKKGEAILAPPDYSACEAFGGCPRKSICNPTAANVLEAIMEQKVSESLLSDLRNRKAKKAPEAVAKTEVIIEEDKKDTTDKINPPDRKEAQQPPPPEPKQAGGKWYMAIWNEPEWKWEFSAEYHAAVAAEEQAKKDAEKAAKAAEKASSKTTTKAASAKASGAAPSASGDLLAALIEMIADRVVEKIKGE